MKEENYINDHFESHVRDSISGHRSNFDGEKMWGFLDGKIPVARQNRRRFGWVPFAGLIILGIMAGHVFINDSMDGLSTSSLQESKTSNKYEITPAITERLNTTEADIYNEDAILIRDFDNQKSSSSQNKNIGRALEGNSNVISTKKKEKNSTSHKALKAVNDIKTMGPVLEKAHNASDATIISKYHFSVPQLSTPPMALLDNEDKTTAAEIPDVQSLQSQSGRWDLTLSALGGVHFTTLDWRSDNQETQGWLEAKKATESQLETVELGFRLNAISPYDFGVSSGLTYVKQTELLEAAIQHTSIVKENMQSTPESHTQDTVLRGINYVTESVTRQVTHYNKRTFLRIPLHLNYHKAFKGWVLGASAGVALTLPLEMEGKSLNPDQNDVVFWQDDTNLNHQQEAFLSYQAQVLIGRQLGRGWMLSLEPGFTGSNASLIGSPSNLTMQQQSFGLNLGLTKML